MKKLLLLLLCLTTGLNAQVNNENILNTDSTNQMNVNWHCPSETYPNVVQLPSTGVISFKVRNNGKIKISPNIFNDGFKPKKILKFLGINKNTISEKQAVSVDSDVCVDALRASLKTQFALDTKDCATKNLNICKLTEENFLEAIDNQIKNSDFAKKTKDSYKLPRILAFNNLMDVPYLDFFKEMGALCEGKPYDKDLILTGGFLKQANNYASTTNSVPGVECLEKLKKEVDSYSEKLLTDHCKASDEVCEYLKGERETVALSIEEMKKTRQNAVDKKEAEYRASANPDWEKEFETKFNSMIDLGMSDSCDTFTNGIQKEDKTGHVSPVTMTKLVAKNMDSLFAKMSSICQKKFIRQYIEQNSFDSVVQDYSLKQFCQVNKAKICDEIRQFTTDIETNLGRMLELSYGEYGKDYFREQLLACQKDNINDLDTLLSKLNTFDKKMICAPLKLGEVKLVSGAIPTGMFSNYALKKTGPNETTAIINIHFTAQPGATVSADEMENRVKSCMNDVSPYMKGGDGERLKVEIVSPAEVAALPGSQRPGQNTVEVSSGPIRSNSEQYDPNIDCSTITHEIMHLFGLCDEYEEQVKGSYLDVATGQVVEGGGQEKVNEGTQKFVISYNCRHVLPIPSIMKTHDEVFSRVVPKSVTCQCSTEMCKDYMSGSEPLQKLFQNYGWDVIDIYNRQKFCKSKTRPDISKSKYLENPKQFALLVPATESTISYNFKYASPDSVKSVDINCDCSKPQGFSNQSVIDDCQSMISRIAKAINENVPPKASGSCSPGTVEKDTKWGGDPVKESNFNGTSYQVLKPRSQPAMVSILYPEQFNRIVGGACDEVATLYSKCSTYAYKTVIDEKTCEVPPECKDMNKLMGIPE